MSQASTDVREVDQTANGETIALSQGATLQLRLPESPTTGFRWNLVSDGQPVLEQTGDQREPPSDGLGTSGSRLWIFRAAQPGSGHIELHYARPWEDGTAPAQTFALDVRVE